MNPKVSILVPVYNVSRFIERCSRSLFSQTFDDIEFIFVDDASPDNSIAILEEVLEDYPSRKNQVKILHHTVNEGLASARNTAINASTSDFIAVVDSDDYVEPGMIEELYQYATRENADIVVFDMQIEFNDRTEIISDKISSQKEEIFTDILTEKNSHNLCNRFVKSKLYKMNECRIPHGLNYHEDFHVCTRIMYFADTIKKMDKVFYHYDFRNNQSITKKITAMHFENTVRFWNLLDEFLKNQGKFENYKLLMDYPKTNRKIRLMIDTQDIKLRRLYADIFREEENRCIHQFSKGEQRFLWLLKHRMFVLFWMLHEGLILKNKFLSINKIR